MTTEAVGKRHNIAKPAPARADGETLAGLLSEAEEGLIIQEAPEFAGLVNWSGGHRLPIHRWFKYREGFSPRLIDALEMGQSILDPFSGTGSILVGAAMKNRSGTGIDVNPLATFATKVKLTPLCSGQIKDVREFARRLEAKLSGNPPWPTPELRIAEKVFEPLILETLLQLRGAIEASALDEQCQNFVMLAWLSILQDVGSYFKEGNGIKYRNRKRVKSGYVRRPEGQWQMERFGADQAGFVVTKFADQLALMLGDVGVWDSGRWSDQVVLHGNSLVELERSSEPDFDSIIFSPPYANRFDYFESMKVELWFGNFVNTYEEMTQLRKRSLRSHLGAALDQPINEILLLESIINLMDRNSYAWRMRVPSMLRGYFSDMSLVLQACRRRLRPGGQCYVVVGNSAYGQVIVPTDSLLARIGLEAGFEQVKLQPVRHLTVAPQQRSQLDGLGNYMRESLIVFS